MKYVIKPSNDGKMYYIGYFKLNIVLHRRGDSYTEQSDVYNYDFYVVAKEPILSNAINVAKNLNSTL